MDLMRACACGLRSTLPTNMPGSDRSAPNRARPVTLSTPSGRTGRVPTHFNLPFSSLSAVAMSVHPHFRRRVEDGPYDLVVSRAAAQIAGQPISHLDFGRVRIFLEQRLGRN